MRLRRARGGPGRCWLGLGGWAAGFVPALAAACPACATRGDVQGPVAWAVAGMILAPLGVGGALVWAARRLEAGR